MPILNPLYGEIIIALITIGFGIFVEKWYVSWSSLFMNGITLAVISFTLDLPFGIIVILGLYGLLALAISNLSGYQGVKQLFGSKGFGSLAFVLGLIASGSIAPNLFMLVWVVIGFFVYLFGYAAEELTR